MHKIWERWLKLYHQHRIPHAVLLVGPHGNDKEKLCHFMEKLMLCLEVGRDGACGICRSCYLYSQHHHPDLLSVQEEEKAIGIDDIREVTRFVETTSHQQGYKVVSMAVDKLSLAASHALLKTLEEPLGDTLFILMTTQVKTLLPTIRSRCFTLTLNSPLPHYSQENLDASLIASDPEKVLSLMYYKVAEFIKRVEGKKAMEAFAFLDQINDARQALSLPGVSKSLLLEPLLENARQYLPVLL